MSQRPAVLTEEIEELRKKVALLGKLISCDCNILVKIQIYTSTFIHKTKFMIEYCIEIPCSASTSLHLSHCSPIRDS